MNQIKNCSQEKTEIQKQLYPKSPNAGFSWCGSKAFPLSPLEVLSLIYFWVVSPEYVKIASPAEGEGFLCPDPQANLSHHRGLFWHCVLASVGEETLKRAFV